MGESIVYVTSHFPYGTGESFLAAEVRAISELVNDMTVVAIRPRSREPVVPIGVPSWRLESSFSSTTLRGAAHTFARQPIKTLRLFSELCRSRYWIVAKLKNIAVFLKGLALADLLVHKRATMIHAHWLTTPSTVALVAARLTDIPVSFSAHRFDIYSDNWLDAKLAECAFVRVISERGARDLRSRVQENFRERVRVVHLGVEIQDRIARGTRKGAFLRVISVGSLIEVKGHRYLIEALAHLREAGVVFRCDIVGEGSLHSALKALVENLRLGDSVRFRGYIPHDTLIAELRSGAHDVFVHPSTEAGTLHEGIPVAIMEAMSLRVACVATRTGSIGELLDDSCGLLVEQRDPEALAAAIRSLGDQDVRERVVSAGEQRIASSFEARDCARKLVHLMRTARLRATC